jgi:N6-adenosine-specific RNA methylase IME4
MTGKKIVVATIPGSLTETGWTPPENMTFEQWTEAGEYFARFERSSAWWLGDWWNSKEPYGDRVEMVRQQLHLDLKTVRNYAVICRKVDVTRRRVTLSFAHHETVAKLPAPKREAWLDKAERGDGERRWNVKALRTEVQRDRMTHKHRELARIDCDKPFSLIYADPPWQFETHSDLGKVMTSADNHYKPMSLKDICNLEIETGDGMKHISEVIADNAVCFMWATVPCLFYAPVAWRAWGFRADHLPLNPDWLTELEDAQQFAGGYSSHAMWDKEVSATGYSFRNQHEILFCVRRGEPPKPVKTFPSVFQFRKGKHSAKPPEIRKYIEEMYPMLGQRNRIELFARGSVPGWTVWGNEAEQSAAHVPCECTTCKGPLHGDPQATCTNQMGLPLGGDRGNEAEPEITPPSITRASNIAPVSAKLEQDVTDVFTQDAMKRHQRFRTTRALKHRYRSQQGGGE